MSTEANHTPTPWAAFPEETDKNYIRIRGTVLGCRYKIANVHIPDHEGVLEHDVNESRKNAELIVHACNSHESVKEAFEAGQFTYLGGEYVFCIPPEKARAALKALKGE